MVNLKSWVIVIFLLNSHVSCQSLKHLKKRNQTNKNKNPVSYRHFDTDASFVSRDNMQGNLITAPAEFDVTFDFAICLWSQKYNRKIERCKNLPKCFSLMVIFLYSRFKSYVVFTSQMLLLMTKYFIFDRHF